MANIIEQQTILNNTLYSNGAALVGYGDLSFLGPDWFDPYLVAISVCVQIDNNILDNLTVNEERFYKHLSELNTKLGNLSIIARYLLSQWGYRSVRLSVDCVTSDNRQLDALKEFPHKTAATCAGLGWVGKSGLLVTPQYGPRVKLGTVLTDAPFPTAEPIMESSCGDCSLCVQACPYGAIRNINWKRGIDRDSLFDAYLCNSKRLSFVTEIGRKHSCGFCLQACRISR